jgi:CheY-like chemotaxis protein
MAARILIVEDNPANLELMTYLLSASGYPTLSARDGVDGLRIAIEELPDLMRRAIAQDERLRSGAAG